MDDRKMFLREKQSQLDEWKAEVDKLKAKASRASADTQKELNRQIETLECKIDDGKARLAEIEPASEGAWESIKVGVESTWDSIKSAFSDTRDKFRN